jgi:pyruvate kinase
VADSITYAASEVASTLCNLVAVATYTTSGYTTMLMARERPRLPIIAITPLINIARRMAIVWGVRSFVNKDSFKNFDKLEEVTIQAARKSGLAKKGDRILITAGLPFNESGNTNMLHTVEIP